MAEARSLHTKATASPISFGSIKRPMMEVGRFSAMKRRSASASDAPKQERLRLQVPDQADQRCGSGEAHRQQEDVDQDIPAPHGSPVDGDLVLEKLAEARFWVGSSMTVDAASRNSVKNMTKKPVTTARLRSTSGPPEKSNQATARNHTTALIAILMTAG